MPKPLTIAAHELLEEHDAATYRKTPEPRLVREQ